MDILSKTKFNNIPNSWQISRFTEIADLIHGFQFREEHFSEDGEFIVIKIGNLSYDGNIKLDNISRTDCIGIKNFDKFFLKKGDVLMALTGGTLGKLSIFNIEDKKFLQNYRVGKFEPKEESDKRYIYYLLGSNYVQKKIEDNVNEAAQPNFGKQDFDKIYVPLPPLPEQKAIADCLSTWDDAIEKQTKLIAAKEQRKKALMQQLLSGKKRLPGFTEDWKEVRLCDICDLIHGYQFRDHDFSKEQTNYAVVKINNIQNGYFRNTELSFITEKRFLELSRFQLFEDDILMSLTGNIGRVVLLPKFDNVLIQNYRVGKFVEKNGVLKKYLKNILSSEQLFNQFNNLSNQSAQANFGKQDMDKLKISIPRNISEQNAVADILENSAAEIELEKKKLLILKRQKKGMMQNLLSGKVRLV